MKPVMYTFINHGLGMSPYKMAAQAQHAAIEAYRLSKPAMVDEWYLGNHYTKVVFVAEDEAQLKNYDLYIKGRGFKTSLIIDEGRTEIKPFSATALGVEIVDKVDPHVLATFEGFKIYKAPKPEDKKIILNEIARKVFPYGR